MRLFAYLAASSLGNSVERACESSSEEVACFSICDRKLEGCYLACDEDDLDCHRDCLRGHGDCETLCPCNAGCPNGCPCPYASPFCNACETDECLQEPSQNVIRISLFNQATLNCDDIHVLIHIYHT